MANEPLAMPDRPSLACFVYGSLKPGMPAHHRLIDFLECPPVPCTVQGRLYVRDGLPLLVREGDVQTKGALLRWKPNLAVEAYKTICAFEPPEHYKWKQVALPSGEQVNLVEGKNHGKGNAQPLSEGVWRLKDDPAFNEGLKVVRDTYKSLSDSAADDVWERFFKAQMAYLLLWSILERLGTLCLGHDLGPNARVNALHQLPGMSELVRQNVTRGDTVYSTLDLKTCTLNKNDPQKCFKYYYQIRSNLSHRGKGIFNEFDKVQKSLGELLSITEGYLNSLHAVN